jgi:hypothetical protein
MMVLIKYIILNEKSIVRRKLFLKVDCRLRMGFPVGQDGSFGGCGILLFRDSDSYPPWEIFPCSTLRCGRVTSDNVLEANKGRDAYLFCR